MKPAHIHLVSFFLFFSCLFVAAMHPMAASGISPAAGTLAGADSDCIALSQRGQQTLLDSMRTLLGDDPAGAQFSDDTVFVAKQLIVGGALADVHHFSQTVESQLGIPLVQLRTPISVGGKSIQLFQIGGTGDQASSVRRLICELDKLAAAGAISQTTFAEPNYLITASQWWAAGSRWRDDNLSQYMLEHTGDKLTDYEAYQNQWSWGADGINLRLNGSRTISQTGAGTRVVLFDSSPFAQPGVFSMTAAINGVATPLYTLRAAEAISQSVLDGSAFPDHGPFVAGLVHAVAPDAELELVRVLGNRDGRATLHDLLTALDQFNRGSAEESNSIPMNRTVLNLSLGVHHPVTPTFATLTVSDTFGLPSEVLSLKQMLQQIHDQGATIVAAAGNDFAYGDPNSTFAEAPADYDFVISVGGSTRGGERSCFSNNGTVFAPGGSGVDDACSGPPAEECKSNPDACLVSTVQSGEATNAEFGYWVGSSFAAPQVSGLAALLLEATSNISATAAQQMATTPQKIGAVIQCSAGTDAVNVINVAQALSPECLTLAQVHLGEVRFPLGAVSVNEDAGMVTITVERVDGSDGTIRVDAATFDGTATPGEDYAATAETLVFNAGETEKSFSIPIMNNSSAEPDETFLVRLSILSGDGSVGAPSELTVTIVDDDAAPPAVLAFANANFAVEEDAGQVTVSVVRSGGMSDTVQVSAFATPGSAELGKDWMLVDGNPLIFGPGVTSQSFTVNILDDAGAEGNESFTVSLSDPVGVALLGEPATTTVTILDDDEASPVEKRVYVPVVWR